MAYTRLRVKPGEDAPLVSYMDWLLACVHNAKWKAGGVMVLPEDAEQHGEIEIYQTGETLAIPEDFEERLKNVLPTIEKMDSEVHKVLVALFTGEKDGVTEENK